MKKALATAALLVGAGCDAGIPPALVEFRLPEGTLSVEAPTVGAARSEEGRASHTLANHARLTIQRIDREDREFGVRTPREVAAAIAERFELNEREGQLSHRPCAAGGLEAECLDGWIAIDAVRYNRRGVVVAAGGSVVWVDVSAPERSARQAQEIADHVRETIAWRSES